jgi:hypothetical protein
VWDWQGKSHIFAKWDGVIRLGYWVGEAEWKACLLTDLKNNLKLFILRKMGTIE